MKYISMLILLLAILQGCIKKEQSLTADDILKVTLEKDSIEADNKSYIKIDLKVDSGIAISKRDVKYEISPIGTFSDGSISYSTSVDLTGNSIVYVKSDKAGTAIVTITIGSYVRQQTVHFINSIQSNDVLSIKVTRDSMPGDNYSYAEIVAISKDPDVVNSKKTITFKTERGTFTNDKDEYTVNTALNGEARAYLKCDKSELVRVIASIGTNYTQEIFVHFLPAWPENIFIDLPQSTLQNTIGNKIQVTAQLRRNTGKATQGQFVIFQAVKLNNIPIGIFTNIKPTGADQISTADFWLQDTSYVGDVYIKGFIVTNNNDTIKGQNHVVIIK